MNLVESQQPSIVPAHQDAVAIHPRSSVAVVETGDVGFVRAGSSAIRLPGQSLYKE